MENINSRKNDLIALSYLKANYYCEKKAKKISSFCIFISIAISFLGIINKYFNEFARLIINNNNSNVDLDLMYSLLSNNINLIAGIVLIINILLGLHIRQLRIASVNILELFDIYIFKLPTNSFIIHPITDAVIHNYASKVRKKNSFFYNIYDSVNKEKNNCLDIQNGIFENEYRLLLYAKPFLTTVWLSYIVIILVLAISFNDNFLSTLINVLFPSLSVISLIIESHYNLKNRLKTLQHCINNMNTYHLLENKKITNNILRNIQDGVYNLRMTSFNIPNFLVKRYKRKQSKLQKRLFKGILKKKSNKASSKRK